MRRWLVPITAAAVALIVVAFATARPATTPKLQGTVGPAFTISLKQNGKKVTKLKAGSYAFVVADKANIHSFVIEQQTGGKFEKTLTAVGFTGTKTTTVKLTKGKWKYYCQPHESQMFGFFTVT